MSSEGHYCDYDFSGSDYMNPDEERQYLEQQHESKERMGQVDPTLPKQKHIELLERTVSWASGGAELYQDLVRDINEYLKNPGALGQALKNAEARSEFLQGLANSHEQGMLERQGKIEALEKEQDALLSTIGSLKSEIRALSKKISTLEVEKAPRKQVIDYRRIDPDLLVDFAISVLENGTDYNGWSSSETGDLEDEIEKKATFHPHVQQEIIRDAQGVLRFRKNALIDRLVSEAGKDSRLTGLNYIATLEAPIEDRAQLAQLIGYSVDGYQSLSYSLPVEEDKIPTK